MRRQVAVSLCLIAAALLWTALARRAISQVPLPPSGEDVIYRQLLNSAARRANPEVITGDWSFTGALRYTRGATANYVLTSDANGAATWATVPSSAITAVPASALPSGLVTDSASVDSTARVVSMATHTLFTPVAAGLYRVSVLQEVTSAAAAGTVVTTIGWTDDNGAQTATPAASLVLTGTGFDQGASLLRVASGSITYKADVAGVVGSPVYSVFIRLEKP